MGAGALGVRITTKHTKHTKKGRPQESLSFSDSSVLRLQTAVLGFLFVSFVCFVVNSPA